MKKVLVLVPDNSRAEWVEEIHECDTANEIYLLVNMATKLVADTDTKLSIEIPEDTSRFDLLIKYIEKY